MGIFKLNSSTTVIASFFGFLLFAMNFVVIFIDGQFDSPFKIVITAILSICYLTFIAIVIIEPIKPLRKQTREELEDHEYERVVIEEVSTISLTEA
jgi:hypothetical protein